MVLGRKATHTHAATTNNEWLAELDGANDLWLNPQPAAGSGSRRRPVEVQRRRDVCPPARVTGDPARLRVHAARPAALAGCVAQSAARPTPTC
jgi:hypothetical protein